MHPDETVQRQLEFFSQRKAGCLFAAIAAGDPGHYGWRFRVLETDVNAIDGSITEAIDDPAVTTLSLLFPHLSTVDSFLDFVGSLKESKMLILDEQAECQGMICLGFRARIGELRSYVTGFGDFPFLPMTRRAPSVELTMRVKPRPPYEFVLKESPKDIVHLADLDMLGFSREKLEALWDGSFVQTKRVLGADPDLRSAAKTTFCIPIEMGV